MLDAIANPWSMTGFYAPLKSSGITIVKRRTTIPVKFAVLRGVQPIRDPAELDLEITIQPVDCSTGAARGSSSPAAAAAGTKLRYDSDSKQFVFNWDTRPIAAGCHALVARAKTGRRSKLL